MDSWEEIDQAAEDGRHELHLNGEVITDKLRRCDGVLPSTLFDLTSLNYLEISDTTLTNVPSGLGKLKNLINLALHRNAIESVPAEIDELTKVKFMDISFNKLTSLPSSFTIATLHTLNLSNNQLEELPDFSKLAGLSTVFIDHNNLTSFPTGIETLTNISEIHAASNKIATFPESIQNMVNIKLLDLTENLIKEVACNLNECRKLKTLDLKNNPLKDNRLKKMTVQCSTKAILEYLAKQNQSGGGKGKKGKKKGKGKKDEDEEEDEGDVRKFYIVKADEANRVDMDSNVKDTRPYICCALIKNLDLSDPSVFKSFITLQVSKINLIILLSVCIPCLPY